MQEHITSFEVAKESIANDLGVSSDVLLTNYDVENPSPDQTTLQQHSAVEIEKLGLSMTYHNNYVYFLNNVIQGGKYVVEDYYIPSAQDPNHYIKIGTVVDLQPGTYANERKLDFVLGREGSTDAANWWKNRVSSDENNHNDEPDKLNFAMRGTFTIILDGKSYVFSDFYIAQGHTFLSNNWWIGSKECRNDGHDLITCNSKDASKFTFYGSVTYADSYDINKVE